MEPAPASPNRNTYPLSALFVLMAACAVVTALLAPVARQVAAGTVGVDEALVASVCGTLVAMCLGAIVGLYHHRRMRGLLWGILTGAALGTILGPVALLPLAEVATVFWLSLAGSFVLIIIGAAFRLSAR